MSTGTALMNRVLLALSSAGLSVWRNSTAVGWGGKSFSLRPGETYTAKGGERVVVDARPIKAGLCPGSSDIIGFKTVTITSDMVGRRIAVFGAWEVKSGSGRPTQEQKQFVSHVAEGGGIASVVRSPEEALAACETWSE